MSHGSASIPGRNETTTSVIAGLLYIAAISGFYAHTLQWRYAAAGEVSVEGGPSPSGTAILAMHAWPGFRSFVEKSTRKPRVHLSPAKPPMAFAARKASPPARQPSRSPRTRKAKGIRPSGLCQDESARLRIRQTGGPKITGQRQGRGRKANETVPCQFTRRSERGRGTVTGVRLRLKACDGTMRRTGGMHAVIGGRLREEWRQWEHETLDVRQGWELQRRSDGRDFGTGDRAFGGSKKLVCYLAFSPTK
nr:hypothetical protein CFP56_08092 [Quercus suber]